MNKNIMIILAILALSISLVAASGLSRRETTTASIACTMEAKLCPDGTSVGRIAPDCRFAPCPGESDDDCVKRPACLDSTPACMIAEPATGWCPVRVGGDIDEHGCKPSAGYTWCDKKQECIRPWETKCTISTNTEDEETDESAEDHMRDLPAQRIFSNVPGLENALLHVNSTEALSRLKANLERWQQKHAFRYQLINATFVGDKTIVLTEDEHTFIFWKVKAKHNLEIDADGNVIREHRNFWAMVYGKTVKEV